MTIKLSLSITIRLRNRTSKYVSKSEENNNIRYFITRSKAENLFQKMTLHKRTAEIARLSLKMTELSKSFLVCSCHYVTHPEFRICNLIIIKGL